nr:hypothetical protein [Tanacetum cinerariifolium]
QKQLGQGIAHRFADHLRLHQAAHVAADFQREAHAFDALLIAHRERSNTPASQQLDAFLQRLFDVLGVQVLAVEDDQILQAPGDEQLVVAGDAQVAAAQPALAVLDDECLRSGVGVLPITLGNTRPRNPHLTHLPRRQCLAGGRIDDAQIRLRGVPGGELVAVETLDAEWLFSLGSADVKRRLGQPRGDANRLGAGKRQAPVVQRKAFHGAGLDPLHAQAVGEIRAAGKRPGVQAHCLKPARRPAEEIVGRHQRQRTAVVQWQQQAAHQPHVVIKRGAGRTGGVLQERQRAGVDRRRLKPDLSLADLFDRCEATAGRHERLQQVLKLIQVFAPAQHHLRRGVVEDAGQAVEVRLAVVLRREGRHCNDPGVQTAEKRRGVVGAGGQNQHAALAALDANVLLQVRGNRARACIKLGVAGQQRRLVLVDDVSKGNPAQPAGGPKAVRNVVEKEWATLKDHRYDDPRAASPALAEGLHAKGFRTLLSGPVSAPHAAALKPGPCAPNTAVAGRRRSIRQPPGNGSPAPTTGCRSSRGCLRSNLAETPPPHCRRSGASDSDGRHWRPECSPECRSAEQLDAIAGNFGVYHFAIGEHAVTLFAAHFLLVHALEDGLDQVGVDHRIVGVAELVEQRDATLLAVVENGVGE